MGLQRLFKLDRYVKATRICRPRLEAYPQRLFSNEKGAPETGRALCLDRGPGRVQALSALTREERRDIFRATVFLCITPLVTPRISSGCAVFSASAAAA